MSESGFTGEGYDTSPSLYADTHRLEQIVEWPQQMLEDNIREYTVFLDKPQMPRATETATRLLEHMMFELVQREDFDDQSRASNELSEVV